MAGVPIKVYTNINDALCRGALDKGCTDITYLI